VTLRFTPEALRQFSAAVRFLRGRSRAAAEQFRRKSDQTLSRLESFPESGRRLEDDPESPYREVVVAPYRYFYRVEGQIVWVVAVWHTSQDPDEPTG